MTFFLHFIVALYTSMLGGATGGLFVGLFSVRRFATGSPGLMTLPVYIGENGLNNLLFACIGSLIAFIVAGVTSYVMFKEDIPQEKELEELVSETDTEEKTFEDTVSIFAPVDGEAIELEKVRDYAFSSGSIGHGCAIVPSGETFVSPVDGTIEMVFETKHAIGINEPVY